MPVTRLLDPESLALKASNVVGESHNEHQYDKHESHHTGPLHDAEGDRPAPDFLDYGPEDVAPVERQEGEEVHDRQRQRDDRQDLDGVGHVAEDGLPGDLVGADHAADLLAALRVEEARRQACRLLADEPEGGPARAHRLAERELLTGPPSVA